MEEPSNESITTKPVKITEVEITNENVALNILVGFLELAHKKNAFTIEETAKIWECIRVFQPKKNNAHTSSTSTA